MNNDNILSMLGLAKRSNNIVSGEFSTEKAVKNNTAKLVIVSTDASDNTKKLFSNKCSFYNVPIAFYSDKESLGHALGQNIRTSVGVTDEGFANSIMKKLNM